MQETKQLIKQKNRDEVFQRLRRNDVVTGVVQEVKPYGVFVDVGSGNRALLHISQVTKVRISAEKLGELFQVCLINSGTL